MYELAAFSAVSMILLEPVHVLWDPAPIDAQLTRQAVCSPSVGFAPWKPHISQQPSLSTRAASARLSDYAWGVTGLSNAAGESAFALPPDSALPSGVPADGLAWPANPAHVRFNIFYKCKAVPMPATCMSLDSADCLISPSTLRFRQDCHAPGVPEPASLAASAPLTPRRSMLRKKAPVADVRVGSCTCPFAAAA